MHIIFINQQKQLDELCEIIKSTDILCIDTEFVRRETYFAKLSLMQIAINDDVYIIDVLSTDIKELWFQIAKSNALIIVHSGSQDFEILYQLYQTLPSKVIDTQIAAKLCGYGSFVSYADLCKKICDIEIDKKHQNSNWLIRELPESMIKYAASDVAMLKQIYLELKKTIDTKLLYSDLEELVYKELLDPARYNNKVQDAWKKIKFLDKSQDFTSKIKKISAFREIYAMALDIPRKHFITDSQVIMICNILPTDNATLRKIKYLKQGLKLPEIKQKLFELCKELTL